MLRELGFTVAEPGYGLPGDRMVGFLQEIRRGRVDAEGLEAINVLRWRDEQDQAGQDSHVRLALHLERGGQLFIRHDGRVSQVEVKPGQLLAHARSR